MITYSKIGHFGRLGNQMFQFASTYGIAKKVGDTVGFPFENTVYPSTEQFKDGVTRDITFDIPKIFPSTKQHLFPIKEIFDGFNRKYQEPYFHFNNEVFELKRNTDLQGYFQSEKYFEHCKNDIKQLFTFDQTPQMVVASKMADINSEHETVAIHVRRGDYLGLSDFHTPLTHTDYYNDAFSYFQDKNYNFLIFSDDITFCKKAFGEAENIFYIYDNKDEVDLCMMSLCDHNIIANSSFSWWGAWLNKNENKKVIAPKQWFGPAYKHNTEDLYCKEWIIV